MVARAASGGIDILRGPGVRWTGPLPLWASPGPTGLRLRDEAAAGRPVILRFDHDDFVQEFIDALHSEPERLGEWIARPETWREPMRSPRPATTDTPQDSPVAFIYDQTRRRTAARRPRLPSAVDLQSVKTRLRKPTARDRSAEDAEAPPLKLYQSGQKRHYLVSASLICERPGLPDCEPDPRRGERVSFVLRRLLPPDDDEAAPLGAWDEYAFVPGPRSSSWRRIGRHDSAGVRALVGGEEQLPGFPVSYQNGCGQSRRLLSAAIPVSRREQWVGAPLGAEAEPGEVGVDATGGSGRSLAGLLFQTDVVAPWKLLLEQAELKRAAAYRSFDSFDSDSSAESRERQRLLRTARDELQTGSWYVLLDFARFLAQHLSAIWGALAGEGELAVLDDGEQALVGLLEQTRLSPSLGLAILTYPFVPFQAPPGFGVTLPGGDTRYNPLHLRYTLADALVAADRAAEGLEAVQTRFTRFDEDGNVLPLDASWPAFLFPLADPLQAAPVPAVAAEELVGLAGLERSQAAVDLLGEKVEQLLPAAEPADELIDSVPVGDARSAWFVLRCVYQRPDCGPMFPPVVSAPTERFEMAPFFDPDAPARPVRIPMPLDISPAGLRKYQKNTGVVMSDMLCGTLKGIRKLTFADLVLSVLPWPFHKDLPDPGKSGPCRDGGGGFGMICSLSIPIVTLCALILLIIMVALFDLFFRWIPYLFVCLPIPGLKGKS